MPTLKKYMDDIKKYADSGETRDMDEKIIEAYCNWELAISGKIDERTLKGIMEKGYLNGIKNAQRAPGKVFGDEDVVIGVYFKVMKSIGNLQSKLEGLKNGQRPYYVAQKGDNGLQKP